MQKWNILTDGAQKVDEKNGVICLVIMFNLRVIVIRMSKMAHCIFYWWQQGTVWAKYLSVSERSYLRISEDTMNYWILSYH